MPIRILITDDHAVVRSGLRALLCADTDLDVVGEAANGVEAMQLAGELHPDLILLDITMPQESGVRIAQRLKEVHPGIKVLFLTMHEDEALLHEALRTGAAGYVIKRAEEMEILQAIHAAMRGDIYVHPAMTRALLHQPVTSEHRRGAPANPLTRREIDVLRLLARGNTEPADRQPPRALDAHRGEPSRQPDGQTRPRQPGRTGEFRRRAQAALRSAGACCRALAPAPGRRAGDDWSVLSTLSGEPAKAYSARSRTSMCAPRASSPRRKEPRDMNRRSTGRKNLLAVAGCAALLGVPCAAFAQVAPPLGTAAQFGALGNSGVTGSTGLGTIVNGDVGSSPTPAISNFPPSTTAFPYTVHLLNDSTVQQAHTDAIAAYNFLAAQGPGLVIADQLDAAVLTSGIYSFSLRRRRPRRQRDPHSQWTRDLRLPGGQRSRRRIPARMFVGTADPCSVFWRVGTSATLNGITFNGNVIADASITVGSTSNVAGQLLAGTGATGAVTMAGSGGNTIGGCSGPPLPPPPSLVEIPALDTGRHGPAHAGARRRGSLRPEAPALRLRNTLGLAFPADS